MPVLHRRFSRALAQIGLSGLTLPGAVFYHAAAALRFEIGGEEDPYLPDGSGPDPLYIEKALFRAKALFEGLPGRPDLLRIDINPAETGAIGPETLERLGLPAPQEAVREELSGAEEKQVLEHLYWELSPAAFVPDQLLTEIIRADLGGLSFLCSNVYFADTERRVIYHLYDDRGADAAAESRETLKGMYRAYKGWLLDYNRERMEEMFEEAGGNGKPVGEGTG